MNSQSKSSSFWQAMAIVALFGGLPYGIGGLMEWLELARSNHSAAIMIFICASLGLVVAWGITYFTPWMENKGYEWNIKVQGKGGFL